MKNRNLFAAMAFIILIFMSVHSLYGQDTPEQIGGELTPEIAWYIKDNTLYLSGNGVVPTTMFGARSAWSNYRTLFNSVVIEDGITGIGQNVFAGYKNINSLIIAGSIKDLAPNSFNTCTKLSVVEVKSAIPPDINSTVFYKLKFKNVKLIVPAGTKAVYEADPFWRKFVAIVESNQPPDVQLTSVETLTEPCNIHLKRTAQFVGGGSAIRVFLNGVEQEKIGNGKTITMQTDRLQNELYLQWGKTVLSIRRFDAIQGGDIRIEYSNFLGYMKIMDDQEEEE